MQTPTIILSIAGSDPSGGAGIQADIKTISALGGYAAAAITAITVQNTRGVTSVDYLPGPLVAAQTEAVLGDLHPAAVKIGMTGRTDIIVNLAACLSKYPDTPVVLDPVMLSSSGHPLMEPDATEALRTELFPRCRLVTPNLNEASFLLGKNLHTLQDMEQAATELSQHYGCAFLLKGGHLEGDRMTDVLFDGQCPHQHKQSARHRLYALIRHRNLPRARQFPPRSRTTGQSLYEQNHQSCQPMGNRQRIRPAVPFSPKP